MRAVTDAEINVETLAELLAGGELPLVLDVRESWEVELCSIAGSEHIPLGELPSRLGELARERVIVAVCHHGMRSAHATAWLRANGFDRALNLAGGIDAWARRIDPEMKVY